MRERLFSPQSETQEQETEMLAAFQEQKAKVLAQAQEGRFNKKPSLRCGLETEVSILNEQGSQVPQKERDRLIEICLEEEPNEFGPELGAGQLEARTTPQNLESNPMDLLSELLHQKEKLARDAKKNGVQILSSGSNPFISLNQIQRTQEKRYKLVPGFHDQHRTILNEETTIESPEGIIDLGRADIIALLNATHVNIEALSPDDAVDKFNHLIPIVPMATSLFGNARFLEGVDTGFNDVHPIAWHNSHFINFDGDCRIGLPQQYIQSLERFFTQLEKFPFILHDPENALSIATGLNWREVRLKIIGGSIVVEFRPIAMQPNPLENFSATLFSLGRLSWSQINGEPLMPLGKVVDNHNQAMRLGMESQLWTFNDISFQQMPARAAMDLELTRAREGLIQRGINHQDVLFALDLVKANIAGGSPGEVLKRKRDKWIIMGLNRKEALTQALLDLGALI